MTWQDDLAVAAASAHAEVLADAAAIAEAARARTRWTDRLQAVDTPVRLHLLGGLTVGGSLAGMSDEVIELAEGAASWVVARSQVAVVDGLPAVLPPDVVQKVPRVPLTWGMALRPWTGQPIDVRLREGTPSVVGTLVSVGADHLDVRTRAQQDVTVPFAAIAAARCG